MSIRHVIEGILEREGGFVDNPDDRGGATNYGITEAVARANGYEGPMRALPKATAYTIYERQYYKAPNFHLLAPISESIAEEVVDTGVNMGVKVAATLLQRALNALNRKGMDYRDLVVDGQVGPATAGALSAFLSHRGKDGELVMLTALNCLQGARYIELAERREANETFVFGWLLHRVTV